MKEDTKKYIRQLADAGTIGFQVAFSIVIGLGIGVWLDSQFGTNPWLTLIFMVLGVAAAALSYYRFVRSQQDEK
ncbi:MAG: AtpZ/AtpI family protein [Syntrophobacteraceae bacterium]